MIIIIFHSVPSPRYEKRHNYICSYELFHPQFLFEHDGVARKLCPRKKNFESNISRAINFIYFLSLLEAVFMYDRES